MDSGGGPGNKETLSLLFTKPAESGHPYLEAQGSMDNGVPWMQSPDFEKTPILSFSTRPGTMWRDQLPPCLLISMTVVSKLNLLVS